jgi:lysophospholipase L1-like esterase
MKQPVIKNKLLMLLFISLAFNVLLLLLGSIVLTKQGFGEYLKQKISYLLSMRTGEYSDQYSVYYHHKHSQFTILPKFNTDIIFLGDSITDEGEWTELLANPNIKNRGISGDTTDGVLNRLNQVIESQPQKIFLMIGVNDLVFKNKSVEKTLETYKQILSNLKTKTPKTQVFIQSVLPVNNQKKYYYNNDNILALNIKLKYLSQDFKYEYIDIFSHLTDASNQLDTRYTLDGLHLNGQGYLVWKKVIEQYVN